MPRFRPIFASILVALFAIAGLVGTVLPAVAAPAQDLYGPTIHLHDGTCRTPVFNQLGYKLQNDTDKDVLMVEGIIDREFKTVDYSTYTLNPHPHGLSGLGSYSRFPKMVTTGCTLPDAIARFEDAFPTYEIITLAEGARREQERNNAQQTTGP